MSSKKASRLMTLLVALIHVFSSEGVFPSNEDRIEVGQCLKENLEHLFNQEYQDPKNIQTLGHFLENFCNLNVKVIQQRYANQVPAPQTDLATLIKNCLKTPHENKKYIFDTYVTIASSVLEQSPPAQVPETPSQTDITIHNLVVELSNENDPEKPDEFTLFFDGLCKYSEFVNYSELKDEKTEILNCCEDCARNFFFDIHRIFNYEIERAEIVLNTPEKTETDSNEPKQTETVLNEPNQAEGSMQVKEIPDKDSIKDLDNFKADCIINNVRDLNGLSNLGILRLQAYGNVFTHIDKVYHSLNIEMEQNLSKAYVDYQYCIRWDCALDTNNKNNVPFDDWLHENEAGKTKYSNFSRAFLLKT